MLEEGGQRFKELFHVVYKCPWDTDILRSREGGKEHWGGASGPAGGQSSSCACLPPEVAHLSAFCSSALHAYVKAHIVNQLQHFPHWTCKRSRVLSSSHHCYQPCLNSQERVRKREASGLTGSMFATCFETSKWFIHTWKWLCVNYTHWSRVFHKNGYHFPPLIKSKRNIKISRGQCNPECKYLGPNWLFVVVVDDDIR